MINTHYIRLATTEDGEAIIQLHEEVYKEKRSLKHWKWKYVDNPISKMYISVVEYEGRIVGQCALLPVWMNVHGLKVLGAQRTDSMVHQNYRGQGMFASLAQECYSRAGADGVRLIYHFPNEQSYSVSVKQLDTSKLGELPQLAKIINARSIIERRIHSATIATLAEKPAYMLLKIWKGAKKPRSMEQVKIKMITDFNRQFDDLWMKIKDRFPISLWKDSNYLNWRYLSCPDREYIVLAAEQGDDLNGFIVLRCGEGESRTGRIVDLLFLSEQIGASLLLQAGLDFLKDRGMEIAVCHVFEHSPFYQLFNDHGFFKYGDRLPLLVRTLTSDSSYDNITDLKQWNLAEGDIDVF